jgi:hypothetical protein
MLTANVRSPSMSSQISDLSMSRDTPTSPSPPPSPTRPGPPITINPDPDVRVLLTAENYAHCRTPFAQHRTTIADLLDAI